MLLPAWAIKQAVSPRSGVHILCFDTCPAMTTAYQADVSPDSNPFMKIQGLALAALSVPPSVR